MSLLKERVVYKPFEYPKAFDYWLKQQQAHWLHTEVPMAQDVTDWKSNMKDYEKNVVGQILKGFAQTETIVNDYWSTLVTKWFRKPEVIMMGTTLGSSETIHAEAYSLLNVLLSKNLNRSDLIIGFGGGITGDVASFVASIFKRGINFINIPTTLLAQVDSSIGGKTGVNSSHGKNLIGSFYQPKLVLIDTTFLKSLPKKEMICGYAEILKHSIIKDKKFFIWFSSFYFHISGNKVL